MTTLLIISISIMLLLVAALTYWVRQQLSMHQHEMRVLQANLESAQLLTGQLQTDLEELRSGVIGVGQRVLLIEEQQDQLQAQQSEIQEQQQAIALSDPESKIYSRAVKMVELGADLEEIMRECELPRAEAELLYNLHRQKPAN